MPDGAYWRLGELVESSGIAPTLSWIHTVAVLVCSLGLPPVCGQSIEPDDEPAGIVAIVGVPPSTLILIQSIVKPLALLTVAEKRVVAAGGRTCWSWSTVRAATMGETDPV